MNAGSCFHTSHIIQSIQVTKKELGKPKIIINLEVYAGCLSIFLPIHTASETKPCVVTHGFVSDSIWSLTHSYQVLLRSFKLLEKRLSHSFQKHCQ